MKKVIITILVILGLLICGILLFNTNVELEYVPEEEIGDKDLRKTMITLYFQNKESKEMQKESRLIDSKELLLDPYVELLNMLMNGPQNDSLEKAIPDGTKILGAELKGNCLNINFSKEFIENSGQSEKEKRNSVYSIVNTLTELTEVNSIKISIEGEAREDFKDIGIDFSLELQRDKNS